MLSVRQYTGILLLGFCVFSANAKPPFSDLNLPLKAGFLASANEDISHNADTPLIPASTIKLLTALQALEWWGNRHQFKTDFFLGENGALYIKGWGDPYFISEELDRVSESLSVKLPAVINQIFIDTSYFSNTIFVEGQSDSLNPYDASAGAVAANFNSLYVKRFKGKLQSAEPQTPLTQSARQISTVISNNQAERISIRSSKIGAAHLGEILLAKLQSNGISTAQPRIEFRKIPQHAKLIYSHKNSHRLEEIIAAMLLYSNNFIANQLFLKLGAERFGAPATIEKAQESVVAFIQERYSWNNAIVREGAGLSRNNRLSARQLTELLEDFKPYRKLLPQMDSNIHAKTGTLKGISTLAGYLYPHQDSAIPFAVLINEPVRRQLRKSIARKLLTAIQQQEK